MQIKCQRNRFIAVAVKRFLFSNEFHSVFLDFYIAFWNNMWYNGCIIFLKEEK